MSSLSNRLRKAKVSLPWSPPATLTPILPLASVQDLLESHSLVRAFRFNIKDVHAAILSLHEQIAAIPTVADKETPVVAPNCRECHKGYLLLNAREAMMVCSNCGMVDNHRSFNVEPEYQTPPSPTRGRKRKGVKGVPNWMLQQHSVPSHAKPHSRFWDDLQSFNHYVSLPEDDIIGLDNILKTWTTGGFSYELRLVSALLYPRVRRHFTNEGTIRACVAKATPIPIVHQLAPEPRFPCPHCQTKCHTAKSARYHCRLGLD